MNEIDPSNSNGSLISDNHQQEATSSSNKSPLLSSLLTSTKYDSISNGQHNKNDHGMMPTPKLVTNAQYDEENAFMTRKTLTQNIEASSNDLKSASDNSYRKYSHSNDHRNNNNNKTNVPSEQLAKSILESCLLSPSSQKIQTQLESHLKMEESEFHHHLGSPSTSSMLKYSEDSRKVEPLKINLNREPIRTVIKLPQSLPHESTNKTAIRTQHQATDRNSTATISPTLSSSSSLSSESSFENCSENANNQRSSSIQVIPKLHIRNLLDVSMNHEQSELHIVPKLTITGLNSPNNSDQQMMKEHSVNSSTDSSLAIPKLTIKKDNNTSDYHLNDSISIPKLHIKTNHVHQAKDGGMKLTIKPIPEPSVPKLTIKTKTDDEMIVVSSEEIIKSKILMKTNMLSKNSTKSAFQEDSIPKLTLKAVINSTTVQTFEKVVPKLLVKLNKEPTEVESSSCSSTPSPPHSLVPKLNIKPILPPEKEVPIPEKICVSQTTSLQGEEMKFSINRLIGSTELSTNDVDGCKPLEINTATVFKGIDSGQDSPRIILKINKTNNETVMTEIVTKSTTNEISPKITSHNKKRLHSNDNGEEYGKKPKLSEEDEDVILINDSDASSNDTANKINHKSDEKHEIPKDNEQMRSAKTNSASRSRRLSRRNHATPQVTDLEPVKPSKEDSRDIDPLALSNDATMNAVEELVTPKRGRGRPKKIVEKTLPTMIVEEESTDPLETQVQEISGPVIEDGSELKKPSSRGRGRGRGRSKRTVEVMKNGKPIQITLEGHDDDDSPSFSLYNRSLRGGFNLGRKSRGGGKSLRGKMSKSSPFITPERSKDSSFMLPNDQQSNRRKLFNTPLIFEEDTRMSIGCDSSQPTPLRPSETQSCEESQSSVLSSASNTVDGSVKKRQKKMDVGEPEG